MERACWAARTSVGANKRALVSGVDHLQHGEHGHDGLAGAHLALQHPVHRRGSPRVRPKAPRALRFGRSVNSNGSCCEAPPAARRRRLSDGTGFAQFAVPPPHQGPLQPDRLVKRQPGAGHARALGALGEVDGAQRFVLGAQIPLPPNHPAAARRSGRARPTPDARRRRRPSSAPWRWPRRSGKKSRSKTASNSASRRMSDAMVFSDLVPLPCPDRR